MEMEFITRCDNVKPHRSELDLVHGVLQIVAMGREPDTPYFEQGRRLRWLRQAERITTGSAFAQKVGWAQSGYSQFETGKRRVPLDKALQLAQRIPGFDPTWLWSGDKKGLSFDLRQRIEAEEAKEIDPQLASGER
jgi:transcriptional regulator with XRE-family HTH domain